MTQGSSLERRVGCAAVVPAWLIGFAGLADYRGPTGWPGVSEFVGWAAVCVVGSVALARLLRRVRLDDPLRYAAALAVFALSAALTYLPIWMSSVGPSMTVKRAFTSSLQVVGTAAALAVVAWIARLGLAGHRMR